MILVPNLLRNVLILLCCMYQLAGYGLWTLLSPKAVLDARDPKLAAARETRKARRWQERIPA